MCGGVAGQDDILLPGNTVVIGTQTSASRYVWMGSPSTRLLAAQSINNFSQLVKRPFQVRFCILFFVSMTTKGSNSTRFLVSNYLNKYLLLFLFLLLQLMFAELFSDFRTITSPIPTSWLPSLVLVTRQEESMIPRE